MEPEENEVTYGEREETPAVPQQETGVDAATAARVKGIIERIKDSKKFFDKDFQRMRECIYLARHGANRDWVAADKYTMPLINRHVNQAVARLYAKHPRAVVKRRRKVYFKYWDGTPQTAQAAVEAVAMGMAGPMEMAILDEIQNAQIEMQRMKALAETLEVVDDYYMKEQAHSYKKQLKKLVRRTKVCGVGYAMLGYQRILGAGPPNPDRDAQIADIRSKIERAEEITGMGEAGNLDEASAEVAELRSILADLQQPEMVVVREGPVISFPKSTQIIVDKCCTQLSTFAGAGWVAREFDMTPSRIKQLYGVDVGTQFTAYGKDRKKKDTAKVWEVYDKIAQQCYTVCDGYPGFLKEPHDPYLKIDRFFPIFALVFNETEEDDENPDCTIYPLSDVWQARHPQYEYNRSREGLREHRVAARPYWVTPKQALEDRDKERLAYHDSHEIIELNLPASEGFDVNKVVQRGPAPPIDPNMYEVESMFSDVLRAVGSQEANIGNVSGATATETQIAETSRSVSFEDQIDDLDEFLSEMAHARGQLYFQLLPLETVMEIAGPGAVWPEQPMTREEVSRDLLLDIRAGSSGRPNVASDLANMERAMPFIIQMPDINIRPYADRYAALLDIDIDEATAEGLPSVTVINQLLGGMGAQGAQGAQPTGNPETDPNAQGAEGAANAPAPDTAPPGPQGAFRHSH